MSLLALLMWALNREIKWNNKLKVLLTFSKFQNIECHAVLQKHFFSLNVKKYSKKKKRAHFIFLLLCSCFIFGIVEYFTLLKSTHILDTIKHHS